MFCQGQDLFCWIFLFSFWIISSIFLATSRFEIAFISHFVYGGQYVDAWVNFSAQVFFWSNQPSPPIASIVRRRAFVAVVPWPWVSLRRGCFRSSLNDEALFCEVAKQQLRAPVF